MVNSYAANIGKNYNPDPNENIFDSIFREYEHVIFESIISSFALDFIISDRHGGDVDTVHNVRKIGIDGNMKYKNTENETVYDGNKPYNTAEYHGDPKFTKIKSDAKKEFNENGTWITDTYTGGKIAPNKGADRAKQAELDHVLSAKGIHDDRGRILADLSGIDLANDPSNLKFTNACLNNNMKDKTVPEYIKWCEENPDKVNWNGNKGESLPDDVKNKMLLEYEKSRKAYDAKINAAYYTSPKFIKDSAAAAGKLGAQMGLRQVLGFFFANVWCAIREEFEKAELEWNLNLDLGDFFRAIANGVKRGFEETMSFEIIRKFIDGGIAGILSSLTTTICNIFFTTAKNVVKIIRQSYASIVQAAKVLFINPDGYLFGDRMLAVTKIIATGASIVVGSTVSIALEGTALGQIPVLGDIVQTFLGSLVTGVMSCTLLLFLDRSKTAQNLVNFLNSIDKGIDKELAYIKQQAKLFENYAAELMNIDIETFQTEVSVYSEFTDELLKCNNAESLNHVLKSMTDKLGIKLPWSGDFDEFMSNRNNTLVFE